MKFFQCLAGFVILLAAACRPEPQPVSDMAEVSSQAE